MKTQLILLFAYFLAISPHSFSQELRIVEATSQEWSGLNEDAAKGVNYIIKIKPKKPSKHLKFERLWVDTVCFEIDEVVNNKIQPITKFKKNEIILIRLAWIHVGIPGSQKNCYHVPIQARHHKLTIEYNYKGEKKYQVVRTIKDLSGGNNN